MILRMHWQGKIQWLSFMISGMQDYNICIIIF